LGTNPQLVQIVRSLLHHLPSSGKMRRVVARTAQGLTRCVGELVLDQVEALANYFIEDGSRHYVEAIHGHDFFAGANIAQGRVDRVSAYAGFAAQAGEDVLHVAGNGVQRAQNVHHLRAEQNKVLDIHFRLIRRYLPLCLV